MELERVDILNPNDFSKTGEVKNISDAWSQGDWLGTFNLWIVQRCENGSLLYQQRSHKGFWAPGLLDVTAGGHYKAGESIEDGLREVREELGKDYLFESLLTLGKKVYLKDTKTRKLRYAVDVFMVQDDSELETFALERKELEGLYRCPLNELVRVHTTPGYSFIARGLSFSGSRLIEAEMKVSADSFPFNWDNYHLKIALLAQRFLNGESPLVY